MANLTWGQFAKRNRFDNNITALYNRAKNDEPMHFVDKHGNINGDGMKLYVKSELGSQTKSYSLHMSSLRIKSQLLDLTSIKQHRAVSSQMFGSLHQQFGKSRVLIFKYFNL